MLATPATLAAQQPTVSPFVERALSRDTTLTVDSSQAGSGTGFVVIEFAAAVRFLLTPMYRELFANNSTSTGILNAARTQALLYAEPLAVT